METNYLTYKRKQDMKVWFLTINYIWKKIKITLFLLHIHELNLRTDNMLFMCDQIVERIYLILNWFSAAVVVFFFIYISWNISTYNVHVCLWYCTYMYLDILLIIFLRVRSILLISIHIFKIKIKTIILVHLSTLIC